MHYKHTHTHTQGLQQKLGIDISQDGNTVRRGRLMSSCSALSLVGTDTSIV